MKKVEIRHADTQELERVVGLYSAAVAIQIRNDLLKTLKPDKRVYIVCASDPGPE